MTDGLGHAHREMDVWLRRMALVLPMVMFIFGFCSGVISTYLLFRDHEKRIIGIETYVIEHTQFTQKYVSNLEGILAELKTEVRHLDARPRR